MREADIAIIGAGIAGLACAHAAMAAGARVVLIEKSRGVGGRVATRRMATPLGEAAFDHGAQFFTAKDPHFQRLVEGWVQAGVAQPWRGRGVGEGRFVGAPGMSAIGKAMATGADVLLGAQAASISRTGAAWCIKDAAGEGLAEADVVIVATPAEQAAPLLGPVSPLLAAQASAATTAPTWAAMLVFEAPPPLAFEAARLEEGALSWIARNSAKPGRRGPEAWVLHASQAWSRANLELSPEAAARRLVAAFRGKISVPKAPMAAYAHRWRYAFVEEAAGAPFGWDGAARIGVCGDWRLGPRVEAAFLSGDAMGKAAAAALAKRAA